MYESKIIRLIRIKHRITTTELSRSMGISQGRYSQIELDELTHTKQLQELAAKGLKKIIEKRFYDACELEADYLKYKDNLLGFLPKWEESE